MNSGKGLTIVLRYGSFDPTIRGQTEVLARAGELGAAVRALTSEGVLETKDHIEKMKELCPQEKPLHGSRQAGSPRRPPP